MGFTRSEDEAETILSRAKRLFGEGDPATAGYLLPDGFWLDFSGVRQGASFGGGRALDHRDINEVEGIEGSGTAGMQEFMLKTGAIRWAMPISRGIAINADIMSPPTSAQYRAMMRAMREATDIEIDVTADHEPHYATYAGLDGTKERRIDYYDSGRKDTFGTPDEPHTIIENIRRFYEQA